MVCRPAAGAPGARLTSGLHATCSLLALVFCVWAAVLVLVCVLGLVQVLVPCWC